MVFWIGVLLSCFLILFVALYYYIKSLTSYWERRGIPYAPPGKIFKLFLQTFLGRIHSTEPFNEVYRQLERAPIGGFLKFLQPTLMAKDPEIIKAITTKDFSSFHDNEAFMNEDVDPVGSQIPFFLKGDRWKEVRSQLTPAFTSNKMRMMFPLILEKCKKLKKHIETNNPEDGFEMKDLAGRYTTDVVFSCALGLDANCIQEPNNILRQMINSLLENNILNNIKMALMLLFPAVGNLLKIRVFSKCVVDFFCQITMEALSKRKASKVTRNDFLQLLIQLQEKGKIFHEKEEEDTESRGTSAIRDLDIVSHTMTFCFGGTESSGIAISFLLYELALNPDIQNKLRCEILTVKEEMEGIVNLDVIRRLPYLDMVFQETLRRHTLGNIFIKICTKTCILPTNDGPVKVETGTPVCIPYYSINHDPKIFPDPDKFDPERFSEENKQKRHKFSFMSFGEGPRSCLGIRLAQAMIKSVVVLLVMDYDILLSTKTKLPIKYEVRSFITTPEGGIWLHFNKRNH